MLWFTGSDLYGGSTDRSESGSSFRDHSADRFIIQFKRYAEMIASLHNKNGRVTIPEFYDDVRPLSKKEREAFKKLPFKEKELC